MKNIIIILLMVFSVSAFSQQRDMGRNDRAPKVKMSPEERAEISSKKMALALDLSEAQRKEVEKLHLAQAHERKEKRAEMRKDAKENNSRRLARMNTNLDRRLAHQEKMKQILTEEQYSKWKESLKKTNRKNRSVIKRTI